MNRPDRGLTLVELAVTALLLSAVVGWTAPSFRRGFHRLEEERAVDLLLTANAAARRASVSRGTVCRLGLEGNGTSCRLSCWDRSTETFVDVQRPLALPKGLRAEGPVAGARYFPDGSATEAEWRCFRGEAPVGLIRVDPFLGESREM